MKLDQVEYLAGQLAFSDYAQKDFAAPPACRRGFNQMTVGGAHHSCRIGVKDAFANAGIDGLFANLGFSGFREFEIRFGSPR
jgi:hypothetical protein